MKDEINADSKEGFMSRWSKRKSNLKHDQGNEKNIKGKTELQESNVNEQKTAIKEEVDESQYSDLNDQELLEKFKLPDPEKIKKEKGLDLFFKDGVPDRLRQIALRRVWKLNPIIRFADAEINDYHEDFTDAATVIEGMQTAYQVGKGYLSEILKDEDNFANVLIDLPIGVSSDSRTVSFSTNSAVGSALRRLARNEYISALSWSSLSTTSLFTVLIELKLYLPNILFIIFIEK